MAKMTVETHPGSGLPHKDHFSLRERLDNVRAWATTVALLFGIATGVGVLGLEIKQLRDIEARNNAAAKIVPASTAEAPKLSTSLPVTTPEATPATVQMTPQEEIAAVTQAQQAALAEGKVKIPVPEDFTPAVGGAIEQSKVYPGGVINLSFIASPEKRDIVVPALVGGRVIEAGRMNANINDILIQVGDQELIIAFPYGDSEFLVEKGQEVSLDTPAFIVHYDPASLNQKRFEADGNTPGTVVILGIQDLTAGAGKGFGQVTKDSILKNAQGLTMTVPPRTSSK